MAETTRTIKRRYSRRITEQEEKRRKLLTLAGIVVILMMAGGMLFYRSARLSEERVRYQTQIEKLETELEAAKQREVELTMRKIEITSDDYIEEEARYRLGLVHDNEILIKRK